VDYFLEAGTPDVEKALVELAKEMRMDFESVLTERIYSLASWGRKAAVLRWTLREVGCLHFVFQRTRKIG
jgi:hypothetical protein